LWYQFIKLAQLSFSFSSKNQKSKMDVDGATNVYPSWEPNSCDAPRGWTQS
jgi:hypothetical protein